MNGIYVTLNFEFIFTFKCKVNLHTKLQVRFSL
jgi:hypothetical protein